MAKAGDERLHGADRQEGLWRSHTGTILQVETEPHVGCAAVGYRTLAGTGTRWRAEFTFEADEDD
jgi:hypothetical protein